MNGTWIGLMDCNNFFVSCERLFRPDLWNMPVAVLSSNDGCIIARSQEVKDLGIPMGMPYFEVRDTCTREGVTVFSSNFPLYRDCSRRVMHALRAEVDCVEQYSIDEAFFTLPDTFAEAEIARIRARIMQKTGIPVSFGVGRTKTIAKAAGDFAKREAGVYIMPDHRWHEESVAIPCGSIWGIGRKTAAKLTRNGIHTVGDFLKKERAYYHNGYGVVGERLYFELSGTSVYRVGEVLSVEKSITSTRSFGREVTERATVLSALGYHVAHVAEKLRARGLVASHLSIIAAPSRFGPFSVRQSVKKAALLPPTADTLTLTKEARHLFAELYTPGMPYKKAGVRVGGLMPLDASPSSLFAPLKDHNRRSSEASLLFDTLNKKFGSGTLKTGLTMDPSWAPKAAKKSKEYTTRWADIAVVKTYESLFETMPKS